MPNVLSFLTIQPIKKEGEKTRSNSVVIDDPETALSMSQQKVPSLMQSIYSLQTKLQRKFAMKQVKIINQCEEILKMEDLSSEIVNVIEGLKKEQQEHLKYFTNPLPKDHAF